MLIGYLERHGLAFGALVDGRREVAGTLEHAPDVRGALARGEAMSRDALVGFALEALTARAFADQPCDVGPSDGGRARCGS